MAEHGFDFYIYGPKSDSRLRKKWLEPWPESYRSEIAKMSRSFIDRGIGFGVALTPHSAHFSDPDQSFELEAKVRILETLGLTHLGVFFDDIPSSEGMAENQLRAVDIVRANTGAKIMFCPTYYSFDPTLDRVFGIRPVDYLSTIAANIPQDVSIYWTGPKVISPEISSSHLEEVTSLLGRRPVIFDNLFANDGPKQCSFLKLAPPEGRSTEATKNANGWAFNPMNQSALSRIAVLAAKNCMLGRQPASLSLGSAVKELCSTELSTFLCSHANFFANTGLGGINSEANSLLQSLLVGNSEEAAVEILRWLRGEFNVGNECLTD
jgi:hypothetical protein